MKTSAAILFLLFFAAGCSTVPKAGPNPDLAGMAEEKTAATTEYLACGCGCCGGLTKPTEFTCVADEDSLQMIMLQDKSRSREQCANAGCSAGKLYKICAE